jgi:hypothetical protein
MTTEIQVVGFDPALNNLGIAHATIELLGVPRITRLNWVKLVTTDNEAGKTVRKNSDDLRRAQHLHGSMLLACTGCAIAIAEIPTGTQSARGAMSNGIALGVLAGLRIPLIEVQATEAKMASVGHKFAAKEEVIQWAVGKYPDAGWKYRKLKGESVLTKDNEHMADAVAVIEAGIRTKQFQAAVMMFTAFKGLKESA